MANLKFTEDGREIISVYKYGYEYVLYEAAVRKQYCPNHIGPQLPQPCFMGNYNFGLHACKKMTTYQLKKLNFKQHE